MPRTAGMNYADAGTYSKVGEGFLTFDIILSEDFTGSINGVAYDGSVAASQNFPFVNQRWDGAIVILTTGSFSVQGGVS